ncbi:MAG: hypothetical protein ACXVH3_37050, partial [Solirubrobacteraceae bacterium]
HFSAESGFTGRIETWGRDAPMKLTAPHSLILGFNALPAMEGVFGFLKSRRNSAPVDDQPAPERPT